MTLLQNIIQARELSRLRCSIDETIFITRKFGCILFNNFLLSQSLKRNSIPLKNKDFANVLSFKNKKSKIVSFIPCKTI